MSGEGTCPRALALRPHRLIPPLPARLSSAASALSLAPCPRHCTASSSCQCSWACSAWTVNRYTPHLQLHGSCTATARDRVGTLTDVTCHAPAHGPGTRTEWPAASTSRTSRIQQAAESRRPCVLAAEFCLIKNSPQAPALHSLSQGILAWRQRLPLCAPPHSSRSSPLCCLSRRQAPRQARARSHLAFLRRVGDEN